MHLLVDRDKSCSLLATTLIPNAQAQWLQDNLFSGLSFNIAPERGKTAVQGTQKLICCYFFHFLDFSLKNRKKEGA